MRVLVIPEDFRNDQYILKPLIERLFQDLGRKSAKVTVCQDPRLGGVGEALKLERLAEIVARYQGMTDIFVLCVDRDGNENRRAQLDDIETRFSTGTKPGREIVFLAVNAWEELETWLLAGLQLPSEWRWSAVREEVDVKERYFESLARKRSVDRHPGGGRKPLGKEAASNIQTIRRKCPDDFDALARRIQVLL